MWSTNADYEAQLKEQRQKTLAHERKAATEGTSLSSKKASRQPVNEQVEALSKRERRQAALQLLVPGDSEAAEVMPQAEEATHFNPGEGPDDATADVWNQRNDLD